MTLNGGQLNLKEFSMTKAEDGVFVEFVRRIEQDMDFLEPPRSFLLRLM